MKTSLLLALGFLATLQSDAPVWRTDRISPRIAVLANRIKAGDSAALDHFWREMRERGAPLVERLPDDPFHALLTFVYRSRSADAVVLTAQLATDREPILLNHLGNSDVWYKTYWIANNIRFSYGIGVKGVATSGSDPLNPKSIDPGMGLGPSVVELPAAPAQQAIQPRSDASHGELVEERVESRILKVPHRVWIYTPAGYDARRGQRYPILICFDGRLYIDKIPVPVILDNLVAAGEIPPMIAIFIEQSPQPQRNVELSNNLPFADFVAGELLPQIRRKWRATDDPAKTVVCGSSAGGLASVFFAFHRPDVFGNVLAQSAALWPGTTRDDRQHEWVIRQYGSAARLNIRFVLQAGLLEVVRTPLDGPTILDSNRHLRDVLKSKGYEVHYSEVAGGHEPIAWRGGVAPGLIQLMGKKGNPDEP